MSEGGCRDLSTPGDDGFLEVKVLWTRKKSIVVIEAKIMFILVNIGERELFAEDLSSQSSKMTPNNTNNCMDLNSVNESVSS